MNKKLLKDALLWGFLLWLFGYVLGFVFFAFVPNWLLGWAIMPFGLVFTIWVLLKKISSESLRDHLILSITWTFIAIILDYFFLVKLLNPADGYYKLDVYLYYTITFLSPILAFWYKNLKKA